MRKSIFALLLYVLVTAPLVYLSAANNPEQVKTQNTPTLLRGAYLQQVTPTSIVIRWRTNISCTSRVWYGTKNSYKLIANDTLLKTEHIIKLTGLKPGTRYYYEIGTITEKLQGDSSFTFLTAPDEESSTPVRIWATGDFGTGSSSQTQVRDAFMNYTGKIPVNLWVWLGDNAYYSGTDSEYQSFVFDIYPEQLKQIPLHPAPGNHDYANSGYKSGNSLTTNFAYFNTFTVPQNSEAGGIPSNTPKYYSYDYGNIHFLSLDSYGSHNDSLSPMYKWIESDLKANSKRWTVVYFHHPPYSMGTHNSDTEIEMITMRNDIIPLLEKYHVDLVLSGHSHSNERSYFIHDHYGLSGTFNSAMKASDDTRYFEKEKTGKGTVYAVCGTSGQNPGAVQGNFPMPCMYFNNNTDNCSMVIDVSGNFMTASYLTKQGTIADRFTIVKSDSGTSPESHFAVYQNPDDDTMTLNIMMEAEGDLGLEIISAAGQTVYSSDSFRTGLQQGVHRIELSKSSLRLATGIYIFKAIHSGAEQSAKVYIENTP